MDMDDFATKGVTFVKSEENMVNEIPTKAIEVKSEENMMNEIPTKANEEKFWEAEEKFWETSSRGMIPMGLLLNWLKNDKGRMFLSMANRRRLIKSKAIGKVTGVAAAWHWALKLQLKELSLAERSIWSNFDNYPSAFFEENELRMRLKPAGQFEKMIDSDLRYSCFVLHRQQVPTAPTMEYVIKASTKTYRKEVEAGHKVAFLDDSKKLDLKNWIFEKIMHYSQVSYHHGRLRAFLAIAEAIEMRVPPHVPSILQKCILEKGKQGH